MPYAIVHFEYDGLSSAGQIRNGRQQEARQESGEEKVGGLLLVFANVLSAQAGLPLPALPMLIVTGAKRTGCVD